MNWTQFAIAVALFVSTYNFIQANKPPASVAQFSPQASPAPIILAAASVSPRLHKMTLEVSQPEDLKVRVGEAISAGQIIADQDVERKRLNLKKEELILAIKRTEAQKITLPVRAIDPDKPKPGLLLLPLPDISYQQYEAAIAKAELEVKRREELLALKQRELDYIRGIGGIDPAIIEHETSKLAELESNLDQAQAELELANGKLTTAKNERKHDEYQHQLNLARRRDEENQALSFYQKQLAENQINYQRQLASYEKELRDKDYQLTQLKLQSSSIEDKIAQLAVIRSPYSGQIKRIKFTGQTDNKLNVELSLIVGSVNESNRTTPSASSSNTTTNPLTPASSTSTPSD